MGLALAKLEIQQALRSAVQAPRPGFTEPVHCHVRTFWGDLLEVTLPEVVSYQIAFSGFYERDLTNIFIECVSPGMTVLDIGAQYGYFTLLAAELVGASGSVHSFEPTKATYEILKKNAKGRPNLHVNNVAVFSESTELEFRDFGTDNCAFNSLYAPRDTRLAESGPIEHVKVKAVSVDDYIAETGVKPDFLKIDAESAEYKILQGMTKTLNDVRPVFTVEVGDSDLEGVPSSKELVQFALSFGYQVYACKEGIIYPHFVSNRYGYDNLLFMPDKRPVN